MSKIGSGDFGELTFLDFISLMSFFIGLQNLDLNVTQDTIDKQTQDLQAELQKAIEDIHSHLQLQDDKLNMIMRWVGLGDFAYDSRGDIQQDSVPHD